jgi:hypothetical protein
VFVFAAAKSTPAIKITAIFGLVSQFIPHEIEGVQTHLLVCSGVPETTKAAKPYTTLDV